MKQGLLNKFKNYSFKRIITYCVLEVFILQTTFSCISFAVISTDSFSEEDIGVTVKPLLRTPKTYFDHRFVVPETETVASGYQVTVFRKDEEVTLTCGFSRSGRVTYSVDGLEEEAGANPLLGLLEVTASERGLGLTFGKIPQSSFISFVLDQHGNTEFISEVSHAAALHFETAGGIYFPRTPKSHSIGILNLLADQVINAGTLNIKRKGTSLIQVRNFLNEKGATITMDAGDLVFNTLIIEGALVAEHRLGLTGKSLTLAESGKVFSRRHGLFVDISNEVTVAGLISGRTGIQLKSRGQLHHTRTGILASNSKVDLDFVEGRLEGRYASLSKDVKGNALQLADLIIRTRSFFAYDPERLRAARLLDMTFVGVPDLRAGIRTPSALRLSVDAGSGVMKLAHPILALGGTDFKAPGIDVVYEGDKASFESDGGISVESKSLDLRGAALSRRGSFTTSIEEVLKVRSAIEATKVHLRAGNLGFYRGEVDPTAAASGAGGGGPIRTLPTVLATSDLGAEGASLVLDADTMNLTEAYLQTSGTLSIINKEEGDFRLPERFRANGYHIDTHGNIIIERPLRPEGEYGLRLLTPKTIRVGREGHLAEVHALRGPLELSAHLLDLRWAQLFSEQDMRLASQTDIFVGAEKRRGITGRTRYHPDHGAVRWTYHDPNGSYLQTNSALFMNSNSVLNDTGRIRVIGDWHISSKEGGLSEIFTNKAGHIRIGGNAHLDVRRFSNTVYPAQRVNVPPKNYIYQDIFEELETSGFSHLRIEGGIVASVLPIFDNKSSIVNVLGNIKVGDTVVSPTGFFRNETMTLERGSRHHKQGHQDKSRSATKTIADVIIGRDAAIPADTVINTGRFTSFRGRHDFYSEDIDPKGIEVGISLTWPDLDTDSTETDETSGAAAASAAGAAAAAAEPFKRH